MALKVQLFFIHLDWIFVTNSMKNNSLQILSNCLVTCIQNATLWLDQLVNENWNKDYFMYLYFISDIYDCMNDTMIDTMISLSELQFFFFWDCINLKEETL